MGLGGNIIWTAILKEISLIDDSPPIICYKPKISDLLVGKLWDRSRSLDNDLVFRKLPFIKFTNNESKSKLSKLFDIFFSILIYPYILKLLYEKLVITLSKRQFKQKHSRIIHIDMITYSYAKKHTAKKMIWKNGGHISEIIANEIGIKISNLSYYLIFSRSEEKWITNFKFTNSNLEKYIIIEPGTNKEWFGELRQWPYQNWTNLVEMIKTHHPYYPIIQIGMIDTQHIKGCLDFRGKTNFREACLLIREASLFIGTEGGLMHAAKAVNAPSVILWGGVTLPEFAGHKDDHTIICNYVNCAPCGNLGWCDYNIKCMNSIRTDIVFDIVHNKLLELK